MREKTEFFLRAMEPDDLNAVFEAENRREALLSGECRVPYSYAFLRQYIDSALKETFLSTGQLRLIVSRHGDTDDALCDNTDAVGDAPAGSLAPAARTDAGIVDFFNYDAFCARAEIGILLYDRARAQGLAPKILHTALDYARNQLNLHQIYAEILAGNAPSLRIFQEAGFEPCGTKKDWFRACGKWIDVLCFQKIF